MIMLKVKLEYEQGNTGDIGSVTGIKMPEWFCVLFFQSDMPDYIRNDTFDVFFNELYSQITDEVFDDIIDNSTAIIYMYNPATAQYEKIYQYN